MFLETAYHAKLINFGKFFVSLLQDCKIDKTRFANFPCFVLNVKPLLVITVFSCNLPAFILSFSIYVLYSNIPFL